MIKELISKANVSREDVHRSDVCGIWHKAWTHVFTSKMRGAYLEFGVFKGDA